MKRLTMRHANRQNGFGFLLMMALMISFAGCQQDGNESGATGGSSGMATEITEQELASLLSREEKIFSQNAVQSDKGDFHVLETSGLAGSDCKGRVLRVLYKKDKLKEIKGHVMRSCLVGIAGATVELGGYILSGDTLKLYTWWDDIPEATASMHWNGVRKQVYLFHGDALKPLEKTMYFRVTTPSISDLNLSESTGEDTLIVERFIADKEKTYDAKWIFAEEGEALMIETEDLMAKRIGKMRAQFEVWN